MDYLPDWNKPGSFSAGRDPLGLQAASVRLYTGLVPGLTNVTNRLRYFSFYCWVVRQFELLHHTADEDKWSIFIRRAEAVYALACQIGDSDEAYGMAGSVWASQNSDLAPGQGFDFTPWTDRPGDDGQYLKARRGNFGQFYVASMLEMGMLEEHTAPVYAVTERYGLELATAFERACQQACKRILDATGTGIVTLNACEEISAQAHPGSLADGGDETRHLREYLCGDRQADPTAAARRATLWNILNVVDRTNAADAYDLRRELYVQDNIGAPPGEGPLRANLQCWQAYSANELCHIALELLLNALTHRINGRGAGTMDSLAGELISAFLTDNATKSIPLSRLAHEMAFPGLDEEHACGDSLAETLAAVANVPDDQDITDAFRLLLSLWARWGSLDSFSRIMEPATVAGRSALGIFRHLDSLAEAPAKDALAALVRRFIISNHLLIAGQKLAGNGTFTYRFVVDENRLVDGVPAEYGFTNPRIGNLITFARDAGLLEDDQLTEIGKVFLRAVQPV